MLTIAGCPLLSLSVLSQGTRMLSLSREGVTLSPDSFPPSCQNSHKAEDDGSGETHKQEEGQGAQDGRDDNHASAPPAGPRVDG